MDRDTSANRTVSVPFGAWYGEEQLALSFPDGWEVTLLPPDDAPALDDAQVAAAFTRPCGTAAVRELVAGRRSVVIAVDDLTRPTPVHRVLPALLDELRAGGIAEENITLLLGTAAHRPLQTDEIERKLGRGIHERLRVVQHDFMGEDIRFVGWVQGGPVHLNRHFLDADIRICIGGVIPHNETGFGGGSKMVVPGVAGRHTIAHFHGALPPRPAGVVEAAPGVLDRRAWSEAVARHVGVDAILACAINSKRELAGLWVGDLVQAHRAAAERALAIGRTPVPAELAQHCDVAVVNAYPLDTDPIQMAKSLYAARELDPASTVVVNAASDGVFYHGMGMGSGLHLPRLLRNLPNWLTSPRDIWTWFRGLSTAAPQPLLAGRLSYFTLNHLAFERFERTEGRQSVTSPARMPSPEDADLLVFSERFPAWGFKRRYRKGHLFDRWDAIAEILDRRHPNGRAAVFPCAPLQIPVTIDP